MPRVSLKPKHLEYLIQLVTWDLEECPSDKVERIEQDKEMLKVLKIAVVRGG